MIPRILATLIALATLGACAATGATPLAGGGDGASGSESPATVMGTFDQEALEAKFETVFTRDELTESKRRYTADYKLPLGLEFTIHPADEMRRILETSLRLSVGRNGSDVAIERVWFRLMLRRQPEALRWLRDQRDEYLADPGADVSIRSLFGPLCAGFFAFGSETSPDGKATTMGYFVETQDAHVNCQGK